MSAENPREFKYLGILLFFVGLYLVAFTFLHRPQSSRFYSNLQNSNYTHLATKRGDDPADPQESIALLTRNNLSMKGKFDDRSTPMVRISSDSLSLRDNTSRSLPGGTVSAASESSPENQRDWEWKLAMLKRFSERRSLLKEKCESYTGPTPVSVSKLRKTTFLYSRKYNLLTCITAKGGSSTWKTHFLRMNGYTKEIGSPHQSSLQNRIVAQQLMDKSRLYRKMHIENREEQIVRVMSVRHPFSRLVSAYIDKFANGTLMAPFKFRIDMLRTALTLMGKPLLPRPMVAFPFSVFLRSLIEENKLSPVNMNSHWRPYISTCWPCSIPYDYIVKMETFEEDLRYLVLKLGIEEINVTTQKNKANTQKTPIYEAYFRDIPDDVIARVYSIYEQDLYLFDYDVPQFVKDALTNMGYRQTFV